MENDDDVQRIMEQAVSNFLACSGLKPVTVDAFVPSGHQTKDLFKNLVTVLATKKTLIYKKWEKFYTVSCLNALSTHEMYLRYVMFACDVESKSSDNIFEKLTDVLALVISYNYETLISAGVNFCKLTVDIFMVYYQKNLKESFYREGGFERFAEYLCHHDSLTEENHKHDLPDSDGQFSERASPLKHVTNKKEIENVPYNPSLITHLDVTNNANCKFLAKEVLSTTKTKLPKLANLPDIKYQMQEARRFKAIVGNLSWSVEAFDTIPEGETRKREKAGSISKCDVLKGVSKCKVTKGVSRCKARKGFSKCKSMKEVSKSKEVIVEGTSELETNDTNLKDEEKTETASECEATEAALKSETTEAISELKASEIDWEGEEKEILPYREATGRVLHQCANMKFGVQGSKEVELKWCEDIVRRVVTYNNSRCSDSADPNNRFQRQANTFLKQMKDIIKSVIDVLEELYEE